MSTEKIVSWSDRIIKICFFALFIAVPLILTPINYELFEYNKMMLTYGLTVIIAAAWLFKSLAQGKFEVARTPLDIPILLFLGSQILSTVFSIDPHVSWMGYYSRFNGGLWSVINYIILYYAFVSNYNDYNHYKNYILNLLKVTLVSAAVVAFYGGLEHFGIDKNLWVQDVQNRVFSTLGQPNWLAAYLVALIPISMALGLKKIEDRASKIGAESRKSKVEASNNSSIFYRLSPSSIFYLLTSLLFFLVLLWTRSRSGLLGFAVADVTFWGLIFLASRLQLRKARPCEAESLLPAFLICHLAFGIIIFFNGTYVDQIDKYFSLNGWQKIISNFQHPNSKIQLPTSNFQHPTTGTLLEYGGTESGAIRKYVWKAAFSAWNSSTKTRLIGTGTETFAFAFFQFKPKAHNLTSEWDFLYNKAHNEYLNYLATTGILGLGSYLLLIGTFVWWFLRSFSHAGLDPAFSSKTLDSRRSLPHTLMRGGNDRIISIALFAGWSSILVTNFFGFSVVIIQLFFFLFPAFTFVTIQQFNNLTMRELTLSAKLNNRFSYGLVCLIGLYLFFVLFKFWYADTLYTAGYRLDRAGNYAAAEPPLAQAANLNTHEPVYHDELSSALAGLAVELANAKEASQAAGLMKESLSESDRALTISPKNVNFWKTRTKIYYSFSGFLPAMNDQAIAALLEAAKLSPLDPKIYYNLAILYGRANNDNKAIELLRQTIDLKPDYRDAYYALYVFYNEVKKPDLAKQTLEDYLAKVDPNDKDFLQRLGK